MFASRVEANQELRSALDRYDHAYAIIRLDEFLFRDAPLENCVTVKKVVRSEAEAQREVERLNGLQQQESGVRYFYQTTRLEKPTAKTSGPTILPPSRCLSVEPESPLQAVPSAIKPPYNLESFEVAPDIHMPAKDGGYEFPRERLAQVVRQPDQTGVIQHGAVTYVLYTKASALGTDLVGIRTTSDGKEQISFAFQAFPGLCKTPLADLTPLELLTTITNRFGYELAVPGSDQTAKIIMKTDIQTKPDGSAELIHVKGDPRTPFAARMDFRDVKKGDVLIVEIALAFAINLTAYGRYLQSNLCKDGPKKLL